MYVLHASTTLTLFKESIFLLVPLQQKLNQMGSDPGRRAWDHLALEAHRPHVKANFLVLDDSSNRGNGRGRRSQKSLKPLRGVSAHIIFL